MLEYVSPGGIGHEAFAIAILPRAGERFLALRDTEELTRETTVEKLEASCYTREELREALAAAGFRAIVFRKFPYSHFWPNLSSLWLKAATPLITPYP